MKTFVERYRLEKGMTLSELSRRSGVAKSHISYMENGISSPTIEILCKLSKALDVSCCDLCSCD